MIFEIEISNQTDADLRGIYEYIAYELQSPDNASGQLDRLEESIMSLDQMPIIRVMYDGRDMDTQLKKYTRQ